MRSLFTAMVRTTRSVLAASAALAAVAGIAVATGGQASADTLRAEDCRAGVDGRIGDQVVVSGTAVRDLVRRGAQDAKTLLLVHDLTIWPQRLADGIAGRQLAVGTVPDARTGTIGGDVIAGAVRHALAGSAGLGALPSTRQATLDSIAKEVANHCGLTVTATDYATPTPPATTPDERPAPAQPSIPAAPATPTTPSAVPDPSASTGGASVPHGDDNTRATAEGEDDVPAATLPSAGSGAPPPAPRHSAPDTAGAGSQALAADGSRTGQSADVRDAGNATSLRAGEGAPDGIRLPMLLAVVALSGATAGLVRRWTLHRVSALRNR